MLGLGGMVAADGRGEALAPSGSELGLPPLDEGTHIWRGVVLEAAGTADVRVVGVEPLEVPDALQYLGSRVYDARDTDGVHVRWYDGAATDDRSPVLQPSTPVTSWVLAAGEPSTTYAMAEFVIVDDDTEYAVPGFRIRYLVQERLQYQDVHQSLVGPVHR